jgi:hypothetical protein
MGLAQAPVQPAEASAGDPVITVQSLGKPKQQCVVVSTTVLPDGSRSYEVQSLETGERFTIQDVPPGMGVGQKSSSHGVLSRLFNRSGDEQAGSAARNGDGASQGAPPNAFSSNSGQSTTGSPSAFTPPPVKPTNPGGAFQMTAGAATPSNAFLNRSPQPGQQPDVGGMPAASQMVDAPSVPEQTSATAPVVAAATVPAVTPAAVHTTPAQVVPQPSGGIVSQSLPQADCSRPDPLMNLEEYHPLPAKRKNEPDVIPETVVATSSKKTPAIPARTTPTPTALVPAVAQPSPSPSKQPLTKADVPHRNEAPSEDEVIPPGLGARSVTAAGSGFFGPNAFMAESGSPLPTTPPPVPPSPVPQTAYAGPPMQPPAVMPNAFTSSPDPRDQTASNGAFHSASWYRMRELAAGSAFPNNSAMAYQGTAPRTSAMGQQAIQQAGYQQSTENASVATIMTSLREALLPSERESAADSLAAVDALANALVVPTLIQSAQHDPCPAVRACCVRSLVHLQANEVMVRLALERLKKDSDAAVRQEAEQALQTMSWKTEAK